MIHLNSDIRLTDELERQLMKEAIEQQARFKPGKAIKNLFTKLGSNSSKKASVNAVSTRGAESAA